MKNIPHIIIDFPDYFPEEFETEISDGLENELLILKFNREKPSAWACLEWAIPGIMAVYILKPYFESFLEEAGKDHYVLLKNKLNDILAKAKEMKVRKITASGSTEKLNKSNRQSQAVSIFIQARNGISIKLLFDDNLDLETWKKSTEYFLELIDAHYANLKENPLSEYLDKLNGEKVRTIYAFIDPLSKQWNVVSDLGQYERERRNIN